MTILTKGAQVGPMVVSAGRWGLPDGQRGRLTMPAADEAALRGAAVVLVLGNPDAQPLWTEGHEVTATGTGDGGESWRFRVAVPGADPAPTIVLVDRDRAKRSGPWAPGLTGSDVLAALHALAGLLGVPWGHSTSRTVEHLIYSTHPIRRGGRKLDRSPTVPDVARGCERALYWRRELTEYEATAAHVHTFDANAAYLGVLGSLDLGFGTPVHYSTPRGCLAHMGYPGVWRVDVPAGFGADGGLPPIASGEWVSTPTLHRLSEYSEARGLGAVVPEEGWSWPARARWLAPAAERLRDARAAALAEEPRAQAAILAAESDAELTAAVSRYVTAGIVREAVKELYTVLPGRFASRSEHVSAGWQRPDWSAAIVGAFRSNLHRKLSRLAATPVAIATDALAFCTDEPNPAVFAASIGLRLGDGLGQFSVQGSARRQDVAEHLAAGRSGVAALFGAVKAAEPVRDASVPVGGGSSPAGRGQR